MTSSADWDPSMEEDGQAMGPTRFVDLGFDVFLNIAQHCSDASTLCRLGRVCTALKRVVLDEEVLVWKPFVVGMKLIPGAEIIKLINLENARVSFGEVSWRAVARQALLEKKVRFFVRLLQDALDRAATAGNGDTAAEYGAWMSDERTRSSIASTALLDLRGGMAVGLRGAPVLAAALAGASSLDSAYLNGHALTAAGVELLALAANPVACVGVADIKMLLPSAPPALLYAAKRIFPITGPATGFGASLRTLSLAENKISGVESGFAVARMIEACPHLTALDVSGNNIDGSGAQTIAACLSQRLVPLSVLVLDDNPIAAVGAGAVLQGLCSCIKGAIARQWGQPSMGDGMTPSITIRMECCGIRSAAVVKPAEDLAAAFRQYADAVMQSVTPQEAADRERRVGHAGRPLRELAIHLGNARTRDSVTVPHSSDPKKRQAALEARRNGATAATIALCDEGLSFSLERAVPLPKALPTRSSNRHDGGGGAAVRAVTLLCMCRVGTKGMVLLENAATETTAENSDKKGCICM